MTEKIKCNPKEEVGKIYDEFRNQMTILIDRIYQLNEAVKPKESIPEVPLGTRKIENGIPMVYVKSSDNCDFSLGEHLLATNESSEPKTVSELLSKGNPCDTITRQHQAATKNEESLKKSTVTIFPDEKSMKDYSKEIYEPTLIPGCPAEVAKQGKPQ